ncbi:Phosphatidate cytidylyltransferase [Metamycoplasma auris 15026]|uniref:Phosphatidate cytidylyltransferase n=1 Tax=Metamycoplasma auris 15026 TaxID=1188233 RepID=N9VD89_9BACT|nr:phosphatidate cytidylyltransferase [Metamycoplasma auris]ENY69386.1 Phosphatidate cytidylyltransferase [Metamycoplasma auris 15026]
MKDIKVRLKSAIILLLILIPFLFVVYYGKISGKIIGIVFYSIISTWAVYEVISHRILKKWESIIIAISSVLIWLMPLDWFLNQPSQIETNSFLNLASNTGINAASLIAQIKETLFFGYDSITKFRVLQLLILITLISFIYIIELFVSKAKLKRKINSYLIVLFVTWFIPLAFKTIFVFNAANIYLLFAMVTIPIFTDSMAYVGGSLIGRKIIKRGFAPTISPKKSWEGVIIGFISGAIFVFITMYLGHLTKSNEIFRVFSNWKQLVVGLIVLPIASIVGDLIFSGIKRILGIKDFSNLIPGHGGFMDRFDSMSLVAISLAAILLIK